MSTIQRALALPITDLNRKLNRNGSIIFYIKKAKEGYAGLTCRSVKKWEDRDKEVWLSDHYPICTELEWINL